MKKSRIISGIISFILIFMLGFGFVYADDTTRVDSQNRSITSKETSTKTLKTALASNEVIVNDFATLKEAITNTSNGITTVYLGSDISMQTGGIAIPAAKSNLIIDGTNPNNGQRHTLNEYPSAVANYTFFINTTRTNATVTLRNMDINGENYYGTVCVYGVAGVTNIFDNVNYVGPQSLYNPAGKAIYRNSSITIPNQYFSSPAEQVAEVSSVSLEGNVNINHTPYSATNIFYCGVANGTINFAKNSNVNIETNCNFNNSVTNTTINFEEGAKVNATQTRSWGPFFYASGGTFNMNPGSSFDNIRTTNNAYSAISMASTSGSFSMDHSDISILTKGSSSSNAPLRIPSANVTNSTIDIETEGNQEIRVLSESGDASFNNSIFNVNIHGSSPIATGYGLLDVGSYNFNSIGSTFNLNMKDTTYGRMLLSGATSLSKGTKFNYTIDGEISSPSISYPAIYATSLEVDQSSITGVHKQNASCGIYVSGTGATALNVKNNSSINIQTPTSATPLVQSQGGTVFDSGSELYLRNEKTTTTTAHPLYSISDLTFGQNTKTKIIVDGGTANVTGAIYIAGASKKVQFNDLAYFAVFAPTANKVINNASILNFNITAQQVNQWTTYNTVSTSGTLNHLPSKSFIKANDTNNFVIGGTIAAGNTGATTVTSSNYVTGDSLNPLNNLSFLSSNSRLMSIGRMSLNVNNGIAGLTSITGSSSPLANVRATYKHNGSNTISNGQAAADGSFNIPTSALDEGNISVMSNWNYLYLTHGALAIPSGSLRFIYVPSEVSFGTAKIPSQTTIFHRSDPSWNIDIKDDRSSSSNWQLTLKLIKPLTPSDISKPILSNALIFVDSAAETQVVTMSDPIIVYTSNGGNVNTTLTWPSNRGLLLKVTPGKVYSGINYSGEVQWILQDTP